MMLSLLELLLMRLLWLLWTLCSDNDCCLSDARLPTEVGLSCRHAHTGVRCRSRVPAED